MMSQKKCQSPQLIWRDGKSSECIPQSVLFDDVYYALDGALEESQTVFIKPNKLPHRFEQAWLNTDVTGFKIVETGFGTGLNFLLTVQSWLAQVNLDVHKAQSNRLHYIAFEKWPLSLDDLIKAHAAFPQLVKLSAQLRAHFPLTLPGWHDVWLFDHTVRLTLWFGDAMAGLSELEVSLHGQVDAWFLDGFAPAKNPEMWQSALYQHMARLSHAQTTFATFTAASDVRRGLEKAGFAVQKAVGWGHKRERLFGHLAQVRQHSSKAPWFERPSPIKTGHAIVVGAGLAGASVAFKLAQAGWQVTVLEASDTVAQHASGNLAGTVHPLVTADWNLRSQWYLQGFEATLRTLLPWLASGDIEGDLTGLVQLAVTQVGKTRVKEALNRVGLPQNFAYWMNQEACSNRVGTKVNAAGMVFPQGGWLNPPSVVARCLAHPNITVACQQTVLQFEYTQAQWQVTTQNKQFFANSLVVATGALASELNSLLGLPIRPVKGQVSHLSAQQQAVGLNCAVMHEGYSVTLHNGEAVTGATFEAPDMTDTVSQASHQANWQITHSALPNWMSVTPSQWAGRVAFRPTTPDHLPIIGPVADPHWMNEQYLTQSHTHAVYRYAPQRYQPGLFVSNGHGPRGLMSVFLAAESIVADLQGWPSLQPKALYYASHPARFAIRRWRSGKQAP